MNVLEYLSRTQIINELQKPFQTYLEQYEIDEIGIYEEAGQEGIYHMGYTVTKDGKTYHIHTSFQKNKDEFLAPLDDLWTLETDEPTEDDRTGYRDLVSVFRKI